MDDSISQCSVNGCTKPVKRPTTGLCYGHYMKNYRYGTPTPHHPTRWVDIRGQRFGTLVVISRQGRNWLCQCDCGRTRLVDAGNLNSSGQKSTCGFRPNHRNKYCKYGAAHERVKTDKGNATRHFCVDCGRQAEHWSYDHNDPNELISDDLGGIPYSTDTACYSPRCVPCHKSFDLGRNRHTFSGTRL